MAEPKSISLKELRWFSVTSDMDSRKRLTIWQSIFYILEFAKSTSEGLFEAMEEIENLERQSAEDVIKYHEDNQQKLKILDTDDGTYLDNTLLPETEIGEEMELLDSNRLALVQYMGLPYTVIYELLKSQINKVVSGERTDLKVSKLCFGNYTQYLFSKGSLKAWNAISELKSLGLIDINDSSSRSQRNDKVENQKLTTGMLIHLLANETSVKYKKGQESKNVNFSKIYLEFKKTSLHDLDDSFPKERTITDNLKASYQLFHEEVNLKEK